MLSLGRKYRNKKVCEAVADDPGDLVEWARSRPSTSQMRMLQSYAKICFERRQLEQSLKDLGVLQDRDPSPARPAFLPPPLPAVGQNRVVLVQGRPSLPLAGSWLPQFMFFFSFLPPLTS